MKKVLIIFLLLGFSGCNSQELEPIDIAELYFSEDTTGISKYLCCDMLEEIDEEYKAYLDSIENSRENPLRHPDIEAEVLYQDKEKAVVSVNLTLDTISEDAYLFFKYEDGWKIEATRALAFTGFMMKYIEEYENISPDQKEMYKKMGKWEDAVRLYEQAKILVSSDKKAIKYFKDNENRFNDLLKESIDKVPLDSTYFIEKSDSIPFLTSLGKELLISQIYRDNNSPIDLKTPGITYFMIGGMLDNTMGFMYLDNSATLPEMSKRGFIVIKEIGKGWYLYKTT